MEQLIFEVSLETFDTAVLKNSFNQPVLVDFWADWCPPCISISPVLEKTIRDHDNPVCLAKLEVDAGENMKLAGRYRVRGFPTIILFSEGEERGRFSGMKHQAWIENFLDQHT